MMRRVVAYLLISSKIEDKRLLVKNNGKGYKYLEFYKECSKYKDIYIIY
jgi:hypothetical protein